jgi:hypothetical protein
MTIKFIENGEAACSWFENGRVSERRFGLEMLEAQNGIRTIPLSRA